MFKFLKEKLKTAISKISEGIEKEGKVEEKVIEKAVEIPKTIEKEPEKKGIFETVKEKITTTKITNDQFEKLFWDLELALMENNVAVEVIEKIKNNLKDELVEKPIKRTKVEETIMLALKNSIGGLFQDNNVDLIQEIKNKKEKPYVIAFFGINGSGKTTSIAKIANMLKNQKISCVLAASDTFRAASIEQLQQYADKIGVKIIKHNYGADPAAVAFDAIKHAKAKGIDVVLIDTAGRMHSNVNLIDEMKKIIRVAKPDLKIFVGESITGNDCVEQAKTFNEAVGIDGIILAKADVDEKGGAAVSVSYVTKKPILFLGTGQKYSDLQQFNSEDIVRNLGIT
jgi:fused signal recognition particle receptor